MATDEVETWLTRFAEEIGNPPPNTADIDSVLRLASVAAHASARQAAPVACWLAAQAGLSPDEAIAAAERMG